MGVVFFVFFVIVGAVFLLGFAVGLASLVLGIIGLATSKKRIQNGKKPRKALSIAGIFLGVFILLIPVLFLVLVLFDMTILPDGITVTDIVIEEYGYQDERFTADGESYVVIHGLTTDASFYTKADAIFTYQTGDSIFDRWETGNYYLVTDSYGVNLVCDEYGNLFCPESRAKEIREKLNSATDYIWMIRGKKLSDECAETLEAFLAEPAVGGRYITVDRSGDDWIYVNKTSSEGIVILKEYEFIIYEEKVHYLRSIGVNGGNIVPVPQNINDEILEIIN